MRKDYLFAGISIIVLVILVSISRNKPDAIQNDTSFPGSKAKVPVVDSSGAILNEAAVSPELKKPTDSNNASEESVSAISAEVVVEFQKQMETVMKCLEPNRPSLDVKNLKPRLEDLVSYFNEQYGQFVVSVEDWSQIDYVLPDGSQRRIRIDTTHRDELGPERELTALVLGGSSTPEYMDIPRDQAINPSEEFIKSMISNGKEVLNEQSKRFFFPGREEFSSVERNGLMESFSFMRNGKTATCSGLDTTNATCQCL